jgi:hypothetical protein
VVLALTRLLAAALVLGGCAAPSPTVATPSPPPAAPAPNTTTTPTPESRPTAPGGTPCGDLGCQTFTSPRAAFDYALRDSPRVVAVGEAHAQKSAGGVESATRRFARDLLPALAPRVKGIVIELLAPDRRCEQHEEQAVAERTKPVTAPQADTNQSDFIALGFEAKKLGIQAEPLVPTCDELRSVLAAQAGDIAALLELIATITVRETSAFLDRKPPTDAIAVYGGLLHNDPTPSADHATWSFGPRVAEHAQGSYVEIDLIVPELVRNEEPWTKLAWFPHYDPARAGNETLLFQTGPKSYVLIFPKTATTAP